MAHTSKSVGISPIFDGAVGIFARCLVDEEHVCYIGFNRKLR